MKISGFFALLLSASTLPAQVIVGFDNDRGGSYNLAAQSGARTAITEALPGATFTFTSSLNDDVFANATGVVLMSPLSNTTGITALTTGEQNSLRSFVERGGFAVVLTDNNSVAALESANKSLLAPFGLNTEGTYQQPSFSIIDPTGNPVSNGSFGLVTSLTGIAQGSLIDAPGHFKPLAQLTGNQMAADFFANNTLAYSASDSSNGPLVAGYFANNALGEGSGAVLFVADANVFHGDWATAENYDLLSNFVTFAAVPEPSTISLLLAGSGAAGFLAWRKRRRR